MKNKMLICLLLAIAFTFTKCKKEDFNLTDPSAIAVTQFYKTPADAEKAVIAVYDAFSSANFGSRQGKNVTDELVFAWNGDADPFDLFRTSPQTPWVIDTWRYNYYTIANANIALDKIPGITFTDAARKAGLIAQAKFFRAWSYFDLLLWYGGVPLVTQTADPAKPETLAPKRATLAEVYAQVEKDLTEAIADLPTYWTGTDVGRISRGSALGVLGQVYLYQKNWAKAKTTFEQLMALSPVNQSGIAHYGLLTNFGDNFQITPDNKWGKEAVFQVNYTNKVAVTNMWSGGGNGVIEKFLGWGWGTPNLYAVSVFENTDTVRLKASMLMAYKVISPGDTVGDRQMNPGKPWSKISEREIYMGKYVIHDHPQDWSHWDGTAPSAGININFIRYADVLLMYAEAVNELNDQTTSISYLNMVRARAVMPLYPLYTYSQSYAGTNVQGTGTQADVRAAIKHERMVELYWENVHFWDLIRWDDAQAAFKAANDFETLQNSTHLLQNFVKGKSELLPIPDSEKKLNPNMKDETNPAG